MEQRPSMGWILEAGGDVVGYLGSIPLLYQYGDTSLLAAVATGFAVDPTYRGYSLRLAASFFKQKNIDLLLNTSAAEPAGKIFQMFKAGTMPQRDYDKVLFWVMRPRPFIKAALKRLNCNAAVVWFGSNFLWPLLTGDTLLRRRTPWAMGGSNRRSVEVRILDVSDVGPEFDDLWHRKAAEEKRLLAVRSAEVLRWHFARQRAKVVSCYEDGKLSGYAVVGRDDLPQIGLARSRIVDLIVEKDDPFVLDQLLRAAYEYTKRDGTHVLEALGFPQQIRQRFLRGKPYSRALSHWPFYYRALDDTIHSELQDERRWYACPLDGDTSLYPQG